jgi:hypothetical protein
MIKNLIARWRQRKLVAQNQPLLGVVPAAETKCCGGDGVCAPAPKPELQVKAKPAVAKKPVAKKPASKPKGKK